VVVVAVVVVVVESSWLTRSGSCNKAAVAADSSPEEG